MTAKFASEIVAAPYNGNVWAWIQARIKSANYTGILVGDYIPFTCSNGYKIKADIAGIDTYYRYGDTEVGHHIDFISRDCWPDEYQWNKANYNNGTSISPYPWLACDLYARLNNLQMSVPNTATANPELIAVDYRTTGLLDKLPIELQNVIVQKRQIIQRRYTEGSLLLEDNGWGWNDVGKLWLPSEMEIVGLGIWSVRAAETPAYTIGGFVQYPIFANNMKRIKGKKDGGVRATYWTSAIASFSSTGTADINYQGHASSHGTSGTGCVPICFRIA